MGIRENVYGGTFSYQTEKTYRKMMVLASQDSQNSSRWPSWHADHVCGLFCDGQDGNGQCSWEKSAGPPSWYKKVEEESVKNLKDIGIRDEIDGLVVTEVVHQGVWGNVFKVQPKGIKSRTYAVKMATTDNSVARLHKERDILDKIGDHENITKIFFAGQLGKESEAGYYIVEEFVPSTLRKKLVWWKTSSSFPPNFELLVDILKQILNGIQFAHSKKVIHLDLKPENILIDVRGTHVAEVRLCDFGLAEIEIEDALESSLDDAKTVAGSLNYLSPEQRAGKAIDTRTDLYNIGLIFYEMLTFKRPTINMVMPSEVQQKRVDGNLPHSISNHIPYPDWVDGFVLKALSAEPADRFQTATEMLEAIELAMAPPEPEVNVVVEPEAEPGFVARCATSVSNGFGKVGRGVWKATKFTLLLPFYIFFAPVIFFSKAMDSKKVRYGGMEPLVMLVAAIWATVWYLGLVPFGLQLNLEHQLARSPAGGTIVFYHSIPSVQEPQGFFLVRGDKLPEIERLYIETPEIGEACIDENKTIRFKPKHALSDDGKLLYYTTPTGLVRIRLDYQKHNEGYREVVVRSEVFNYFSTLAFVSRGPSGDGLYAKLKNETWFITTEGLLKQTDAVSFSNYSQRSYDNYSIDGNEVEFNSYLPGNFNLGPHADSGDGVWYPFLIKPIFWDSPRGE